MASDATVTSPTAGQELGCPFSPAGPVVAGARPRPKRGYLIPGTIALVVCAAIGTVIDVAGLQSRTPSTLQGRQVETFLSQSIQALHPQASPPQVGCPSDEPLRVGFTFDCSLLEGGRATTTIRVTETSANGTFRYALIPPA